MQAQVNASGGASNDAIRAELAKNQALLGERRQQRAEALAGQGASTRSVSQKEAISLDQALRKAGEELRRDFTTLFQRYHSGLSALAEVNVTRNALASVNRH